MRTADEVEISWIAPDSGGPITSYSIIRNLETVLSDLGPESRSATVQDPPANPPASYQVLASGPGGQTPSETVTEQFLPVGKPADVVVANGQRGEECCSPVPSGDTPVPRFVIYTVVLQWNPPTSGGPVATYAITVNGSTIVEGLDPATTSQEVDFVAGGDYRVVAVGFDESRAVSDPQPVPG